MTILEFNLERELFRKVEVRQANAHLLNRGQIRRIAFYGYAIASVSPVSKASFPRFHLDATDPYPFGVDKANQLLDAAGYPRNAEGRRFAVTIHANPFNEGFKRTAHYEFQAIVIREIPSISLVQAQNLTVYNRRVGGFNLAAAGLRGNIAGVHFKDA